MMRRLLFTLALVAATAIPARSAAGLALLPQTLGQRVTYHLVRSVQTLTGPQTSMSTFTVVRRAGTTLVIERSGPNGTPNLSVLKSNPDSSLALADPRTTSDGDLADVLYGLNLAIAATREGDPSATGTWLAVVPVAPDPGATSAPIVLVPSATGKATFDFSGSAETSSATSVPARKRSASIAGPIALTIHIEGHAANGAASRIAVTQTRTVTIGMLPFVNVGSWTITVAP